jgi:hypothetical protein
VDDRNQDTAMADSKLEPPLELDFKGNPGVVSFATLEEVEKFVADEVAAWTPIFEAASKLDKAGRGPFDMIVTPQKQALAAIETAVKQQHTIAKKAPSIPSAPFAKIFAPYVAGVCCHANSNIGREILQAGRPEADAISLFMAMPNATQFQSQTPSGSPLLINPIVTGVVLSTLLREGLVGDGKEPQSPTADAGAANKSLAPLMAELAKMVKVLGERGADKGAPAPATAAIAEIGDADALKQVAADAAQLFAEQRQDHDAELERLRVAYMQHMKAQEPRQVWVRKRARHRRNAAIWGVAFWSGCAAALAGVYFCGAEIVDFAASAGEPGAAGGWVAIALPAIVGIWLLAFLYRRTMANLRRMADADERVTMVETYLALHRAGKSAATDRPIVLKALFRPFHANDAGAPQTPVDRAINALAK